MAVCLASEPSLLLHHPQQWQSTLGELLHDVLRLVDDVDCRPVLHHGLDGEFQDYTLH